MTLDVSMILTGQDAGASAAIKSVAGETKKLTKATRASGDVAEKSNADATRSFKKLKASIDPVYRAELNLKKTQDLLNQSVRKGVVTQGEATRMMRQYTTATKNGAVAAGQMSRRMSSGVSQQRRIGLAVQNSSYQFADLAVQIGGGVAPSQALAMQLPQLLGGFGILGSVMGAVVAIGIPLGRALFGMGDAAADVSDDVDDAGESVSKLSGLLDNLSTKADLAGTDLTAMFGPVTGEVKTLLERLETAQFRELMHPMRQAVRDVGSDVQLMNQLFSLTEEEIRALPTDKLDEIQKLIEFNNRLFTDLAHPFDNLALAMDRIGEAQSLKDFVERLAHAHDLATQFGGPVARAVVSGIEAMAIEAGVLEQILGDAAGQGERLAAAFEHAKEESFLYSRRFADEEAVFGQSFDIDPANNHDDTPPRRTGGGGGAANTNAVKKLLDGLQSEIDLLAELNPLEQEMIRLRGQLADATDAEIEKVRELITERNLERDALDQTISRLDRLRDGARSAFDTIIDGVREGTSALDIMLNVLFDIGSKLTDVAGDSLVDALFGSKGSSDGGAVGGGLSDFFGSIFGFANGDIFDSPTMFGFGNGKLGVMGEAGKEGIMPLTHSFGEGVGASIGGIETALPLKRLNSGKLGVSIQPFAKGGTFGSYAGPVSQSSPTPAPFGRSGGGVVNNWNIQTDNPRSFAEGKATTARAGSRFMGEMGRYT